MAETSKIEWTDATPMYDRGGRRVRFYKRKKTNRPGTQERRKMAAIGFRWCRGCKAWLDAVVVLKEGVCQPCANTEMRDRYAKSEGFREARKAHRDRHRRSVERMPMHAKELVLELFDGQCAYCDARATSWDHVIPVSKGGKTVPGNMVPACLSCNSAKHDLPWLTWVERTPSMKLYTVEYLTCFGVSDE
jgi:5-methylcytosine-specific restriction endonuclease McrA